MEGRRVKRWEVGKCGAQAEGAAKHPLDQADRLPVLKDFGSHHLRQVGRCLHRTRDLLTLGELLTHIALLGQLLDLGSLRHSTPSMVRRGEAR